MTVLIAHRGNTNGGGGPYENKPSYIKEALQAGYHVEIDCVMIGEKFYLGHDEPQYEVDLDFLAIARLVVHCKNLDLLLALRNINKQRVLTMIEFFYHSEDYATMTSTGRVWIHPRALPMVCDLYRQRQENNTVGYINLGNAVAVLPEQVEDPSFDELAPLFFGICTDNVNNYKKTLEKNRETVNAA
jgi:hypothetical protein